MGATVRPVGMGLSRRTQWTLDGGGGHGLDSEPVGFPPGDPRGDRKAWSFSVVTGERQEPVGFSRPFSLAEHGVGQRKC